jgi:hypothetical protein
MKALRWWAVAGIVMLAGAVRAATPAEPTGPYTGLIIDAGGLGLHRSMSPKIFHTDGRELWGTVDVSSDFVLNHGIAGFAGSLAEALDPAFTVRVGNHPLVIRAIGVQPNGICYAAVSEDDAARIVAAEVHDHFLAEFRVVFVVDD